MTRFAAVLLLVAVAGCTASRPAPVEDRRARAAPAAPKAQARAPAPAAAQPAPSASAAAAEGTYVVKRGDTLYSIALEHGADYRELAQWNGLDDPGRLLVGQVLRLDAPTTGAVEIAPTRGAIAGRVEARPLDPVPPARGAAPTAAPKVEAKPAPAPVATKPETPKVAAAAPAVPGEFVWPLKGKVLAGFAEPRRKGIDIDGRPGDAVVAAAPGRVTYTGTGIPGLGKLVVIRHEGGFITVYAHNNNILVKEQQSVARGQKIAEVGSTDAERPKLHFQIRKGAAAVDPMRYLPAP